MTSGNEMIPTRHTAPQDLATLDARVVGASRRAAPQPRWSRRRGVLSVFAAFAAVGFVAAYIGPTGVALSQASAVERAPITLYSSTLPDAQRLSIDQAADGEVTAAFELDRGGYS
ncbi:MAG: hypothetical protein ACXW28_14985, partial [Thermoanaerobaculia bacterium]